VRVIVTGHNGYVGPVFGRHVAERKLHFELIGVDTGFFADQLNDSDPARFFRREIHADVRALPDDVLRGANAVVYLAAISNDPMGAEFETATMQINAAAAIALAKRCRAAGVTRFVFASSCSIYGAAGEAPRAEGDALNPLTAYAHSKVVAEEGLRALADEDFLVTSLRFATACGASQRLRLDLVLNDFVASAVQTGRIEVLSDGSPWRPLIHVEDMARAIEWALLREGEAFITVNTGSRQWSWQIGELAREVACVLGRIEVSINEAAQPDNRSYRVDFSRFEQLAPEHQPRKSFAAAVCELRDQIERIDFGGVSFRKSRFLRLNVLRELKAASKLSQDLRWSVPSAAELRADVCGSNVPKCRQRNAI
jgi:nucleoside-diphosphate-sugar epimerase